MLNEIKPRYSTLVNCILILILLLNSGVYVIVYFSSTILIKETIHFLIENDEFEDELIILSISKNDIEKKIVKFEWVEDREFRYNGMMYDVKKDLSDTDSLRFLCYADKHENLLEKIFNRFSDLNKNKRSNHIYKFVFTPFLGLFFQETKCFDNLTKLTTFSFDISQNIIHNYKEVLTPPPQTNSNFG